MGKNKFYCRINGTIENLKDIQDILDGVVEGDITMNMCHKHGFEPLEALLFEDVIKFNNNEIPTDYNECLERMRARNSARHSNVPKCPTCGSTNIEKISVTKKVTGGFLFGLFSSDVRNTMHCKKCGHKW